MPTSRFPLLFQRIGGLSRRIYVAFLLAAVIPMALAGGIGVYLSLSALKAETLRNLEQEVTVRSQGIGRFFDQLAAELLYLANSRNVLDVVAAQQSNNDRLLQTATARLERDYAVLASLYPHVYQIRLLAVDGQERVRIDRKPDGTHVVPRHALQAKGDRYYFQEAMQVQRGQIYVSPLDLNVEFGQIEKPERPVIRVATLVSDLQGQTVGILVFNLHADILLEQIQQMANVRQGVAFLLDSQGHYLSRTAGTAANANVFAMEPVANLRERFSSRIASSLAVGGDSPSQGDGWIVAHAPIDYAAQIQATNSHGKWRIALAFPEQALFMAIVNLYLLYAVLLVALVVVAAGGYAVSRRLLQPLDDLAQETDAIAAGDFSRRVRILGGDEIAALGQRFNSMAERLQTSARAINAHRGRLESEVRARTSELEQERAALAAVIEHTADGIFVIDAAGAIVLLNPAARQLLGPAPVVLGTQLAHYWPQWPDIAARAVQGPLRQDLMLQSQVLSLAITPTSVGFVVVARDVSSERAIQDERRELDRQMFQMEKLTTLGELAMGLAHEVGNPLAGMKAVVQSLLYEADLSATLREALQRLEQEVDRLSGFLRSFHGFATPQTMQVEPCLLSVLLDDVLYWTRKEARTRNIRFDLEGVGDLPPLAADANQLKQVLLNLLINAVHALPQGGQVTVSAGAQDGFALLRLVDNGIGMEADVLQRIFDPFFTTRREGTGLGLAIVYKIVQQHGAEITVHSRPGHGTCFELRWPFAGKLDVRTDIDR